LETVPDTREASALLDALEGLGIPAWLSYTVEGGRTRAGQPLDEAFALLAGHPGVIAVGVNCSSPADATAAVPLAFGATGLPVVVYPNSGERWDLAARWLADGARLIGGCCRVRPADIARIARALPSV